MTGVLDVSFPHVYALLVDVRHRTNKIYATPAMAFAVAVLLVDLAFLLVPLNDGSNILFAESSPDDLPIVGRGEVIDWSAQEHTVL